MSSCRQRFRGNSRVIAIVILVALLLLTGGAVFYFLSSAASGGSSGTSAGAGNSGAGTGAGNGTDAATGAPSSAPKALPWADAPSSALAAGGVNSPRQIMEQVRGLIDTAVANNAALNTQWRKAQSDMAAYFGVDLTDPAKLPTLGIDPNQPVHFSVLEFDAKDEPTGAVVSCGITSEDQFMSFVKGVADREFQVLTDDTAGQPKVVRLPGNAALAVSNGRAYLMGGNHDENLPAILRRFIVEKERSPIVQAPGLVSAVDTIGGPGDATAYVDLKTIVEHNGGALGTIVADFRSVAIKASPKLNIASLNFAPGCRLVRALKPGASPKDFIAKADKPLAALSISLADPGELVRYIAQSGPGGSANLAKMSAHIQQVTGLSFDDWGELLKGGNLGFLLYKSDAPPYVNFMIFARLHQNNAEQSKKVKASVQQILNLLPLLAPILGKSAYTMNTLDEYISFGNASEQIRGLSADSTPKWQPVNSISDVLTIEYWIGELGKHLQRKAPNRESALLAGDGKLTFALQQKNDSIQYTTDTIEVGTATVLLVSTLAIPGLLRTRMEAQEIAAYYGCKAFYEAQEIYRRTDFGKRGVLEYSRTLRGLYETRPGAGDVALIDRTSADAEGRPGKVSDSKAGYCFVMLSAQGPNAASGRKTYLVAQKDGSQYMTQGWALAAYPKTWNVTGRKTYLINQDGVVYQKDLGPKTNAVIENMTEFDPDKSWSAVTYDK